MTRVRLRWLRTGELLAGAGAVAVVVSLLVRWYEGPSGTLDAWDTFGPAVVLLLAAVCGAAALLLSTVAERTVALPVALAVWTVLLSLAAAIAAVVRVLERPDGSTRVCVGAWLALAGAVAMLLGAWLALRDERTSTYEPTLPPPRPPPRA